MTTPHPDPSRAITSVVTPLAPEASPVARALLDPETNPTLDEFDTGHRYSYTGEHGTTCGINPLDLPGPVLAAFAHYHDAKRLVGAQCETVSLYTLTPADLGTVAAAPPGSNVHEGDYLLTHWFVHPDHAALAATYLLPPVSEARPVDVRAMEEQGLTVNAWMLQDGLAPVYRAFSIRVAAGHEWRIAVNTLQLAAHLCVAPWWQPNALAQPNGQSVMIQLLGNDLVRSAAEAASGFEEMFRSGSLAGVLAATHRQLFAHFAATLAFTVRAVEAMTQGQDGPGPLAPARPDITS